MWPNPCYGKLNISLPEGGLTELRCFTPDEIMKLQRTFNGQKGELKYFSIPEIINKGIVFVMVKDCHSIKSFKLLFL